MSLAALAFGCADVADDATEDEALIEGNTASVEGPLAAPPGGPGANPEVKISDGKLRGKLAGTTREFLGIPYAKAPVGALRFAPPQPFGSWSGTRDATQFGPSCVQNPGALAAPGPQSEDCLSLNVYAPVGGSGLPVMVFIHGGAFVAGGSVQYDGQRLSEEGKAVVVTLNYRLGPLGLLSHPQLDAERGKVSGNNALRDQQLALEWVKKNIQAFGGKPDRVTLFGESAGSWSTCLNLASPLTPKQYGYIMQSGTCVAGLTLLQKAQAQGLAQLMGAELCPGATDQIGCLRTKTAAEIQAWHATAGITGAGFAPVIGDDFLPAHPSDLLKTSGKRAQVIVGSNVREWGLFQAVGLDQPITSVAQYNATVDATFGPQLGPALRTLVYPAPSDAVANAQWVTLMTDYLFRCPARQLAREVTAAGGKAYLYHFEEGLAFHAFELPYVFGNPSATLGVPTEPARAIIQKYWSTFAAKGNPNAPGQVNWPLYNSSSDQHMSLKGAPAIGANLQKPQCDFWASLPRP